LLFCQSFEFSFFRTKICIKMPVYQSYQKNADALNSSGHLTTINTFLHPGTPSCLGGRVGYNF
jgi:hypothetical protein